MSKPCLTSAEKVVEATLGYYRQAEALARNAAQEEVIVWYMTLSDVIKEDLLLLNAGKWRELASFKRYLLERHGFAMQDYMEARLTRDELTYWVDDNKGAYW